MGTDAATKTAAHTPGPWGYAGSGIVKAADGTTVAHAINVHPLGTGDANARLIASAPQLLAALKAIHFEISNLRWGRPYPGRPHGVLDAAEAAIAVAEGSAP